MGTGSGPRIGEVSPTEAWRLLNESPDSRLVDVRTRAEWGYVGTPDLSEIDGAPIYVEWAAFPDMSPNPQFVAEVMDALEDNVPQTLLFICRSGVRSLRAATAVASYLDDVGKQATCLNVAEGFEGDLNGAGHRGDHNGWKARGLAWRQS